MNIRHEPTDPGKVRDGRPKTRVTPRSRERRVTRAAVVGVLADAEDVDDEDEGGAAGDGSLR